MTEAQEINAWNDADKIVMPYSAANFASAECVDRKSFFHFFIGSTRPEITIKTVPEKMAWVLWELCKAGARGVRYA